MTGSRRPSLWRRLGNSLRARSRSSTGTLDVIPDGFIFTQREKPVQILWSEITQIDAGMQDYLMLDVFFAVLRTAREAVTVDELVDGFRHLENGVFEHWPQVRARWLALQGGPAHQPQYENLWRR